MPRVEATAYASIAFIKYWGKAEGPGNRPATDSIGINLEALKTVTTAVPIDGDDQVFLDGEPVTGAGLTKLTAFLQLVRELADATTGFRIESHNAFPTAAGLASSSSGYAALAAAASAAVGLELTLPDLSALARRGSGSAARSIPGGFVRMRSTALEPHAVTLQTAEALPLAFAVGIVDVGPKAISSRDGMNRTTATSSYHPGWIERAQTDCDAFEQALERGDLDAAGALAEANALAMHADAMGARPPVVYFRGPTLEAFHLAARLRRQGHPVYATCDAGPHPILFFHRDATEVATDALTNLPGIASVLVSGTAPGVQMRVLP